MTNYGFDNRVVLTLDAGGTNFVFSAIQSNNEITENVCLSAVSDNLEGVLKRIISGFEQVQEKTNGAAVAISFAFPGPADYPNGIIGNLCNLPLFRGGVALKAMLEEHFGIPVFINNDGDLFAYGEAISGFLPNINAKLAEAGNPKQFKNLLGVTLGTGFGGGVVSNGKLFFGDNSAQGEVNRMMNAQLPGCSVEETASIRGIKRLYQKYAGIYPCQCPEPVEICKIGSGEVQGDQAAAIKAFDEFGRTIAQTICDAASIVDGLVVIGGGLTGASSLFLEPLIDEMRKPYETVNGDQISRLEVESYNLENEKELSEFLCGDVRTIPVPFSHKKVTYDAAQRIGVGISNLGTNRAVALGAYAFALNALDA